MTGAWVEILKTYGLAVLLILAAMGFVYRELWPWFKDWVASHDRERVEREQVMRRQMDSLTNVIDKTADSVADSTRVNQELVKRVEHLGIEIQRLRSEVVAKKRARKTQ